MKRVKIKVQIAVDPGFGPNYTFKAKAVITNDPTNDQYRITWFDRNLQPKGHFTVTTDDLRYILKHRDLTDWLKIEFTRPFNCKPNQISLKFDEKDKSSLSEQKTIIFELINETMFGHRFKVVIGDTLFPALVSKNVAHEQRKEAEYRITWFDSKTMEPKNHVDFGEETLNYVLRYKKFPLGVAIKYFKLGLPVPKIIAEIVKQSPIQTTDVNILVGTIDPDDDYIEAKFGGSHQKLNCRTNRKGDFRFNDESEVVYWHEEHPVQYEVLVDEYILNTLGQEVKKHVTLDRVRGDKTAYTYYWNDAHGIDQPDDKKY